MISRHWTGIARAERANDYLGHLRSDTFPKLTRLDGFMGASVLRRDVPQGVEFRVITTWETWHAITQFAGKDPALAVVPEVVQAMMESFDARVAHYEIVDSYFPRRG